MPDPSGLIRTVAIFGPGLIGGSFALALRQAGFKGEILGVGESPFVERAFDLQVITKISSLEHAAQVSDLLYLSENVDRICRLLQELSPTVRAGCLITDSGSTKRLIDQTARAYLSPGIFLGGHPMAGKEKRGVENAEATLFHDRPYILSARPETHLGDEFVYWLKLIGAKVVYLDPEEHDRAVAFASHLPQLLSTALALTLSRQNTSPVKEVAGPGLQQMIRLARSNPELWASILESNGDEIRNALEAFAETLDELRLSLPTARIKALFAEAGEYSYLLTNKPD